MKYTPGERSEFFRDHGTQMTVYEYYRGRYDKAREAGKPQVYGALKHTPTALIPIFIGVLCALILVVRQGPVYTTFALSGFFGGGAWTYLLMSTDSNLDIGTKRSLRLNSLLFVVLFGIPFVYSILGMFNVIEFKESLAFGMAGVALAVLSLWFIYHSFISKLVRRKLYDSSSIATCIGYVDKAVDRDDDHRAYMISTPIYEFTYTGQTYQVYGERSERNEFKLPTIGSRDEVRFNSSDPYDCMVGYKFKISISFIIIAVIAGFFSFACLSEFVKKPENDVTTTQQELVVPDQYTDEYITEYLKRNYSSVENPEDYVVYKREIINRERVDGAVDVFWFESIPGINDVYYDDYNEYVSYSYDSFYYVTVNNHNISFVFPCDRDYIGTHTPENAGIFTEDGRLIIDDDLISEYFIPNERWEIGIGTITDVEEGKFYYEVNGSNWVTTINKNSHTTMYDDLEIGDEIYTIKSDSHNRELPLKHFYYSGSKLG